MNRIWNEYMSRFKRWIENGMNIWADLRDEKDMEWIYEQILEINRIWYEYMSRFMRWIEYGMNIWTDLRGE